MTNFNCESEKTMNPKWMPNVISSKYSCNSSEKRTEISLAAIISRSSKCLIESVIFCSWELIVHSVAA